MDGGGDGRRPGSTAVGPGRLGAGGPVRSSGSGVDRDGFRVSRRLPLGGSGWAPLPLLEGPAASRDRGSLGLAAGSRPALSWALAGPVTLPSPRCSPKKSARTVAACWPWAWSPTPLPPSAAQPGSAPRTPPGCGVCAGRCGGEVGCGRKRSGSTVGRHDTSIVVSTPLHNHRPHTMGPAGHPTLVQAQSGFFPARTHVPVGSTRFPPFPGGVRNTVNPRGGSRHGPRRPRPSHPACRPVRDPGREQAPPFFFPSPICRGKPVNRYGYRRPKKKKFETTIRRQGVIFSPIRQNRVP